MTAEGAPQRTDALTRRIEIRATIVAAVLALGALAARGGEPDVAAGVVGGWVLVAASAWLTRTGVEGLLALGAEDVAARQREHRRYLRMSMRFIARYALLGLGAYVIIVRLRLSPIGVLLGASSIVVSTSIEITRTLVNSRVR